MIITGVQNVESFNEECIVVDTLLGRIVRGANMHINKLDVESAALDVEGRLPYRILGYNCATAKGGFFQICLMVIIYVA